MPKWLKFILAVLLLPVCLGAARALGRVVTLSLSADLVWVPFIAGFACWVAIYLLLPKPMIVYVFGHELTHAVWTWMFGGKVKRFKVTPKGGHVIITKTNFLIGLSPYFFPLYAVLVLVFFGIGHLIWKWDEFSAVLFLLLGFAYAFHVTLTIFVLQMKQTDITDQGYFFSAVVIFLGNISVLLIGLPLMTGKATLSMALNLWLRFTVESFSAIANLIQTKVS